VIFASAGSQIRTCPCESVTIPYSLSNSGNFFERYSIYVSSHESAYVIIPGEVGLVPDGSAEGAILFKSACDEFGDLSTKLIVEARSSGIIEELPITTTVDACYDFTLTTSSYVEACDKDVTVFDVNISNIAKISNEYDFELIGEPSWANLYGDNIALFPQQNGYTQVVLDPIEDVGSYIFTLEAKSRIGDLVAAQDVFVEVPVCHGVNLTVPETIDVCQEQLTVPIPITNLGRYDKLVNISAFGPEFMLLGDTQIEVAAGETEEVDLVFNATDIRIKDYKADITVKYADNALIVQRMNVNIATHTNTDCYKVTFTPTRFVINKSIIQNAVNITQEGIKPADYTLSFDGPDFVQLDKANITLAPGESETVVLETAPGVNQTDGKYWVNIYADTHDVSYTGKIRFDVGKTSRLGFYLLALVILLLIIVLVVLIGLLSGKPKDKKKEVVQKATPKKAEKKVVAKKTASKTVSEKKEEKEKSNWWKWLLFIIFIIIILFFIVWIVARSIPIGLVGLNATNVTNATIPAVVNGTADNATGCGLFCSLGEWWSGLFVPVNATALNATNATIPVDDEAVNATNMTDCGFFCSIGEWWNSLFVPVNTTATNATNTTFPVVIINETATNTTVNATNATDCGFFCSLGEWWSSLFVPINSTVTNTTFPVVIINETVTNTTVNATNATDCGFFCSLGEWWSSLFIPVNVTSVNVTGEDATDNNITIDLTDREKSIMRVNEVLVEANESGQLGTFSYQVWPENSKHAVNLTNYFMDPDMDIITFDYFPIEDIDIVVEKGMATFTPKKNFVGVRYTSFIAEDPEGETVRSPVMTIVVVPNDSFLIRYANIILTIALIILVLLIVVLYEISRPAEGKKPKKGKKRK